jgi:hypothetical protein
LEVAFGLKKSLTHLPNVEKITKKSNFDSMLYCGRLEELTIVFEGGLAQLYEVLPRTMFYVNSFSTRAPVLCKSVQYPCVSFVA